MKVMVDLNVLLDVVQGREPFYPASAQVLGALLRGKAIGCIPGHALTTLHYILSRGNSAEMADEFIDWLLARFEILGEDHGVFARARSLKMTDFEDAVVASAAENAGCRWIVTRNPKNFLASPVAASTPEELIAEWSD
ncbi:MAG: Predicted nucleic acid-binding protein, contains PIN domain [Candidatus Kentron sp. G]|nr:MAG: Predicted nucleic acid-binding protein, contains PIN domain [Candidatus Kentron sp. G]VFN05472.1 MAG: Predicted nucleic acid-binding protein, contains PIN domain [Candidatus Kentron sp. G]VFN06477.1 MAG: Predicted nucleic acid-binding protein, contains PIN domain [Candidatus Kentron sp. G]